MKTLIIRGLLIIGMLGVPANLYSYSPIPYFDDIPDTHWAFEYVQRLYEAEITYGCNPPVNNLYCPGNYVTRAQMSAYVMRTVDYMVDSEIMPTVLADDGSGSGLDADLLDGQHASFFASSSHLHSGSDITTGTVADPRIAATIARDTEVTSTVNAHANRADNPHSVTAAQTGAAPSVHTHDTRYYTESESNTRFVNTTGDSMTGTLNLPSNGFAVGTNQFVVSGGNVGVGTASPAAKLQIDDINRGLGNYKNILIKTTGTFGVNKGGSIGFGGTFNSIGGITEWASIAGRKEDSTEGNRAAYLAFATTDTVQQERVRITSTGSVGIGTTNPDSKLQIKGAGNTNATSSLNITDSGGNSMIYVQDDGIVGIGVTEPGGELHIHDDSSLVRLRLSNSTTGIFGTFGAVISMLDDELRIINKENDKLHFGTANSFDMTIDSTGNVGIGTITPDYKIDVKGDGLNNRIQLTEEATGDTIAMRTDGTVLDFTFGGNSLAIQGSSEGEDIVLNPSINSNVGIGTWIPTAELDVNGSTGYNQLRIRTSYTPSGTGDSNGNTGDIAWDDNYVYVKTSVGWKRSALSTF